MSSESMAVQSPPTEDSKWLVALAVALVELPRATTQELAQAAGISRATLHRLCGTREQLIDKVLRHSATALTKALESSGLSTLPPLEALRLLIANTLEHRELCTFMIHYWWQYGSVSGIPDGQWEATLDAFFLRGQREGVFRLDMPTAGLSDYWSYTLIGLIDAERRGRIGRAGLATLIENAFLRGGQAN